VRIRVSACAALFEPEDRRASNLQGTRPKRPASCLDAIHELTLGIEVTGQYSGGASVELFTIGQIDKVWVLRKGLSSGQKIVVKGSILLSQML
jgi:hypothetical protein